MAGEGDEQRLVARDVIEHAEEKVRLARGHTQRLRPDPAQRQEPAKLFGLAGDEAERGNGKRCRRVRPRVDLGLPWPRRLPFFIAISVA